MATAVGTLGSLLSGIAGSAWDNAKKHIETCAHGGRDLAARDPTHGRLGRADEQAQVDNPTYLAAVLGDTLGDPLKGAVGPAAQALATTLIALGMVLLPFFL
ncbi:MAG: sodium/proton-translocating pyrophosphatase [Deltaproteobacteria bacterium]|nr:sodium/proton-translocating pyrophosphatase [Deltaproteobacteria bacterium]